MPNNNLNLSQSFRPHPLTRSPHFQTIVASLYRTRPGPMCAAARELILDAAEGVRLQGFYSPQPAGRSKGLVLLLHGWLGQANASYNLSIGEYLYRHGYAVFRLNMRDHGDTHHLNPGLFRADLLDEAFNAARQVPQLESDRPFYIVGSSLGGSFAARLAWRHRQTPLPNLTHTVAISPAFTPRPIMLAMDNGAIFYANYFRRKWQRSLKKKAAAFPGQYDFSEMLSAPTCMAMTDIFVRDFTQYPHTQAYFDSYAVTPAMLSTLQTPVSLISAVDDPVVPVATLHPFARLTPYVQLYLQPYGGHVGFIDLFPFRRWVAEAALSILAGERLNEEPQ